MAQTKKAKIVSLRSREPIDNDPNVAEELRALAEAIEAGRVDCMRITLIIEDARGIHKPYTLGDTLDHVYMCGVLSSALSLAQEEMKVRE